MNFNVQSVGLMTGATCRSWQNLFGSSCKQLSSPVRYRNDLSPRLESSFATPFAQQSICSERDVGTNGELIWEVTVANFREQKKSADSLYYVQMSLMSPTLLYSGFTSIHTRVWICLPIEHRADTSSYHHTVTAKSVVIGGYRVSGIVKHDQGLSEISRL